MTTEVQERQSAVEFATTTRVHVSINVSNIERSLPFYKVLFGQEPTKVRPGYVKFEVAEPPVNFTLNENSSFTPGGTISHFGIQVKSTTQVLAAKDRFIESKLTTFSEDEVTCCYAVQDKVWVTDPDGNNWEVFVVLEADAPVHSISQQGSINACACDTGANTATGRGKTIELINQSSAKCC
jgi:catechol 2,3-dioxygenase-like lactoylglutathione lyase family enzyme